MTTTEFQRARRPEQKQARGQAILDAAARLGAERGIRQVTLTDIAEAVGMHKSALLRYFETREQIFLQLTAAGWQEWSATLLKRLRPGATPAGIAEAMAATLVARPMFCDLLAQAPLNLERNVSLESVSRFKQATLAEVATITALLRETLPELSAEAAGDVVAAATSLAGALWQMATPPAEVAALYAREPGLEHARVDVEPRLARTLEAMIRGFLSA